MPTKGNDKGDLWIDMTKVKLADGRLELCQISRLLQLIRRRDFVAIDSLVAKGVPSIIDYVHPGDPNSGGETALGLAASVNDEEMLEHLFKLGANPNVFDLKGRSASMRAAEYGHMQAMEVLAHHKIDMKIVDESGQGVLFYCIGPTKRHYQCGEIALCNGADVSNKTRQGTPILMYACETAKDNEEFCLALLKAGANPLLADEESNRTAVMAAASSGSARVIRSLLTEANNANEVMNRVRMHALHEAAKRGHFDAIKMLASFGADFNQCTDKAYSTAETPIHMAAAAGKPDSIVFLASRGCDAIAKNKENKTAKNLAQELGVKPVVKACSKAEKMTKSKVKPPLSLIRLHDFCFLYDPELTAAYQLLDPENKRIVSTADFTKVLFAAGAPIPDNPDEWKTVLANHAGPVKDNILWYAFLGGRKLLPKAYLMSSFEAKFKKPKKPKKVVVKGWPMPICTLPPDQVDLGTIVPRHFDVTDLERFDRDRPPMNSLEDDTAWYMERPADTTIRFNLALRQDDRNTVRDATYVQTITPEGTVFVPVNQEPPSHNQSAKGATPKKAWKVPILNKKAQVNLCDSMWKTPLMVACSMGNLDLVKMMVKAGADINAVDNFYWTPLHHAAFSGVRSVVEYLMTQGSNVEAPAINATTPLYRAIESGNAEVVQYMVDNGAKVFVENRCAMAPLDVAACYADYEVWNIIKKKVDSTPIPKGAKKPNKKAKVPAAKPEKPPQPPGPIDLLPPLNIVDHLDGHLPSIPYLRTRTDNDTAENITFLPQHVWNKTMTSAELVLARQNRRRQLGWLADFEGYESPFHRNISKKLTIVEAEELAALEYKRKTGKR